MSAAKHGNRNENAPVRTGAIKTVFSSITPVEVYELCSDTDEWKPISVGVVLLQEVEEGGLRVLVTNYEAPHEKPHLNVTLDRQFPIYYYSDENNTTTKAVSIICSGGTTHFAFRVHVQFLSTAQSLGFEVVKHENDESEESTASQEESQSSPGTQSGDADGEGAAKSNNRKGKGGKQYFSRAQVQTMIYAKEVLNNEEDNNEEDNNEEECLAILGDVCTIGFLDKKTEIDKKNRRLNYKATGLPIVATEDQLKFARNLLLDLDHKDDAWKNKQDFRKHLCSSAFIIAVEFVESKAFTAVWKKRDQLTEKDRQDIEPYEIKESSSATPATSTASLRPVESQPRDESVSRGQSLSSNKKTKKRPAASAAAAAKARKDYEENYEDSTEEDEDMVMEDSRSDDESSKKKSGIMDSRMKSSEEDEEEEIAPTSRKRRRMKSPEKKLLAAFKPSPARSSTDSSMRRKSMEVRSTLPPAASTRPTATATNSPSRHRTKIVTKPPTSGTPAPRCESRRRRQTLPVSSKQEEQPSEDEIHVGAEDNFEDDAYEHGEEALDNVNNEAEPLLGQHDERPETSGRLGMVLLAFFGVLVLSSVIATFSMDILPEMTTSMWNNGIPCFADHGSNNADLHHHHRNEDLAPHCENVGARVPCPHGAWWAGGWLKQRSKFQEIDGNNCVLTKDAKTLIENTVEWLKLSSVKQKCDASWEKSPFYVGQSDQGCPLFSFEDVAGEICAGTSTSTGELKRLIEVANTKEPTVLLPKTSSSGLAIGLHPSERIDVPFLCSLSHGLKGLLAGTLALFGAGIVTLGSWFSCAFSAFPFWTLVALLIGFLILKLMRVIHDKQKRKKPVELDVVNLRNTVYAELRKTIGVAVTADILRDHIVWVMCPTNRAERVRLSTEIWPMVIVDISTDSRVRKTMGAAASGYEQVQWTWIDQPVRSNNHGRQHV